MPKNELGSLTGCLHRQSALSRLLAVLEVNFENDALVSGCFSQAKVEVGTSVTACNSPLVYFVNKEPKITGSGDNFLIEF